MSKIKLAISVDDEHLDKMPEVVKRIKKAGLKIDRQLDSLGIIVGSIEEDKLKTLRDVKGVSSVEPERGIQIPPPDSDLQ